MSFAKFHLPFFASMVVSVTVPLQGAVNFEKEILPVLEAKCFSCHKAPYTEDGKLKKPKADLRLDAAWAMLKGAENGPALVPGNLTKSHMYEVVTLPKDDDMFMPPKGDPLTESEIKNLKKWIEEGAAFGGWKGNLEGAPKDPEKDKPAAVKTRDHETFYQKLEDGIKPVEQSTLNTAKAAGAQISTIKVNSALLRVDFLTGVSKCDDEKVAVLLPLKDNIAQLDLGRTIITDAALKTVASFPRLASLDLRQTRVTDEGLNSLKGLKNLQSINLFGTSITDAGIKHLAAITTLKTVTLYQSKVTASGANALTTAIPGIKVTLK